jgi:hypothetical protein
MNGFREGEGETSREAAARIVHEMTTFSERVGGPPHVHEG